MGMTVYVSDFSGEILRRGQVDVRDLVEAARRARLPFLAHVDEYDNTIFNRMQLSVLLSELEELARAGAASSQVDEVSEFAAVVSARPHRYLVFNGD